MISRTKITFLLNGQQNYGSHIIFSHNDDEFCTSHYIKFISFISEIIDQVYNYQLQQQTNG